MVVLAMRKETNIVKAAIPIIPMISDYFFSDPAAMTTEERLNQESMKVVWKYIAKVGITLHISETFYFSTVRTSRKTGLTHYCSLARHRTPC